VPLRKMRGDAQAAGAPSAAIAPFPWRIEKDPSSSAVVRTGDTSATLEFRLSDGERAGQFVALATDIERQSFGSIDLSLAADRPMRVSVQLRSAEGKRWGRSYYVDRQPSSVRVPVSALSPIGSTSGERIESTEATSLLLVVDLTNAEPGARRFPYRSRQRFHALGARRGNLVQGLPKIAREQSVTERFAQCFFRDLPRNHCRLLPGILRWGSGDERSQAAAVSISPSCASVR
jgi:hypothetical protein